jgi:hypothetical protein
MKVENAVGYETILGLDRDQLAKHVIPLHQLQLDKINE